MSERLGRNALIVGASGIVGRAAFERYRAAVDELLSASPSLEPG